jgi:hypothetical protein
MDPLNQKSDNSLQSAPASNDVPNDGTGEFYQSLTQRTASMLTTLQALFVSTHGSSLSQALSAPATQKLKNGSRSWTPKRVDWRSSREAMSASASPSHPTTQSHTASGPPALCAHT